MFAVLAALSCKSAHTFDFLTGRKTVMLRMRNDLKFLENNKIFIYSSLSAICCLFAFFISFFPPPWTIISFPIRMGLGI
jgi:hypothetical protein